jgi:hypothetical protein
MPVHNLEEGSGTEILWSGDDEWHVVVAIQIWVMGADLCCAQGAVDVGDAGPGHVHRAGGAVDVVWGVKNGKLLPEKRKREVLGNFRDEKNDIEMERIRMGLTVVVIRCIEVLEIQNARLELFVIGPFNSIDPPSKQYPTSPPVAECAYKPSIGRG